jgi:hypothetical protein
MFILLLSLSSLLVAGCAAFFSVLGIAGLFSGCYYQVMFMAGSLELAKLVATSFLYRYWNKTNKFLRAYLLIAVGVLMIITSAGIFGYLSSAYQVNASKDVLDNNKISLIENQKQSVNEEIQQIQNRITTLNEARKAKLEASKQADLETVKKLCKQHGFTATNLRGCLTTRGKGDAGEKKAPTKKVVAKTKPNKLKLKKNTN